MHSTHLLVAAHLPHRVFVTEFIITIFSGGGTWRNGNMTGGLAREAAKQPIILTKHLCVTVKIAPPPSFATLGHIDDSKLINEKYQIKDHAYLLAGTEGNLLK